MEGPVFAANSTTTTRRFCVWGVGAQRVHQKEKPRLVSASLKRLRLHLKRLNVVRHRQTSLVAGRRAISTVGLDRFVGRARG